MRWLQVLHEQARRPSRAGIHRIRRVLVVEDSPLQRRILVACLRKWGLSVDEAENGEQALEKCAAAPFDLIVSDWMMPGMDGLDFCRAFRNLPGDGYGYFILLTSKSEKTDIAQGLDAGADDFLTKPVNPQELRARIAAGARILEMQRELSEKNRLIGDTLDQLQLAYDRIDQDLIQARKIQRSLLPELSRDFGGSRVSLLLRPCGHIGGDLVGMFAAGPDQVGFYNIDVSGHGITSAMMTARLGSHLSSRYADQNLAIDQTRAGPGRLHPPHRLAAILNARLIEDTGIDEYFTMAYGVADLASGRVEMVQAGHPHPLVLRRDGGAEFLGSGGLPVGLIADARYHGFSTHLQPGDRLLIYSDGFTEARLKTGEMLGAEGLARLIAADAGRLEGREFLDDLFGRLSESLSAQFGLEDDVSATLFEFGAP